MRRHALTPSPRRRPRTLLLVRGKLGDTIAAWPTIRAYADRHPDEEVCLAVRGAYLPLFEREPGIRFLPFNTSAQLYFTILRLRLSGGIAKLATLWGFGKAAQRAAQLSGAPQRAYLDHRLGSAYNLIAPATPDDTIGDVAWRVASQLDPELPRPRLLALPALASRRSPAADAIALAPVADEARRVIDANGIAMLVRAARERFPNAPLWLLGNPHDAALNQLLAQGLPSGLVLKQFQSIPELIGLMTQTRSLFCVDTGLYHLAAAMGIPAQVFFGPSQSLRVLLPQQPGVSGVRLPQLGNLHCEVKTCLRPHCLYEAVAHWAGDPLPQRPAQLPDGCLLTATESHTP